MTVRISACGRRQTARVAPLTTPGGRRACSTHCKTMLSPPERLTTFDVTGGCPRQQYSPSAGSGGPCAAALARGAAAGPAALLSAAGLPVAPRAPTLATGAAAAGLGLAVRPSRGGAPAAGSAAAASTLREAPVTAEASICWHKACVGKLTDQ